MTKIERRRDIVTLHHGTFEHQLADLRDRAVQALQDEESGATPRRFGSTSESMRLAREYDALMETEDENTAAKVIVWALRFDELEDLQDEHPVREDEALDKLHRVNMKTFPRQLLEASLIPPDDAEDLADRRAKGRVALLALEVSKLHYKKLETAAWNVNIGDDAISKVSLVSRLQDWKDFISKPQSDTESAPQSSTGTSPERPTSTSTPTETAPATP